MTYRRTWDNGISVVALADCKALPSGDKADDFINALLDRMSRTGVTDIIPLGRTTPEGFTPYVLPPSHMTMFAAKDGDQVREVGAVVSTPANGTDLERQMIFAAFVLLPLLGPARKYHSQQAC